jgi:hypothetical protein
MLGSAPVMAFVPSTDLERSRRFYADLLGLTPASGPPQAATRSPGSKTPTATPSPSPSSPLPCEQDRDRPR